MKNYFSLVFAILVHYYVVFAHVDTLSVYSPSMDKNMPAAVVLPNTYHDTDHEHPVIYLLHGAYGDFRDWLAKLPDDGVVHSLADQYDIIFVLPEGGTFSFYLDSPWDESSRYETHVAQEVVQYIDKHYRTIKLPSGRAITGLSMGGQGALFLAARHPDIFGAAGSMSGAVHLDIKSWDLPQDDIDRLFSAFANTMGGDDFDPEFLAANSATGLVKLMKENNMPLIIDCGVDDFLISANRELNRRLLKHGVPHDYIERPGAHDWPYWQNAIYYHALFFSRFFENNKSR